MPHLGIRRGRELHHALIRCPQSEVVSIGPFLDPLGLLSPGAPPPEDTTTTAPGIYLTARRFPVGSVELFVSLLSAESAEDDLTLREVLTGDWSETVFIDTTAYLWAQAEVVCLAAYRTNLVRHAIYRLWDDPRFTAALVAEELRTGMCATDPYLDLVESAFWLEWLRRYYARQADVTGRDTEGNGMVTFTCK